MMRLELLTEHPGMSLFPLRSGPCRIVDSVCHIAHVKFLRKIARPHMSENIAADLTVKP